MNQQLLQAYQACPYKAWRLTRETRTVAEDIESSSPKAKRLWTAERCIQATDPPPFYQNKHCPTCPWQKDCRQQLEKRDCISLLAGVLAKYHKRGITTILQLSHLFRPRRRGRSLPQAGRYPYELKALAIREQKIYVLHTPEIPQAPVSIFLDMEGLPKDRFVYLIGGVIRQEGKPDQPFSFWAETPEQEERIFQQAADLFAQYPDAFIYHYGSYETKALKRWPFLAGIEKRMVNLLAYLRTHVFPPVYGNGLKEVGKFIGCAWTDPAASGLKSIDWRQQWEHTGGARWKKQLLQYNSEDVQALLHLKDWFGTPGRNSDETPCPLSLPDQSRVRRRLSGDQQGCVFRLPAQPDLLADQWQCEGKAILFQRETRH